MIQKEKIIAAAHCNIPAHEPRFSELIKLRASVARDLLGHGLRSSEILEGMIEAYNQELRDILGL